MASRTDVELTVLAQRAEDWRAGDLRYKIVDDLTQFGLYEEILACPTGEFVVEGARKIGKSFLAGVIAEELCQQNPGKQVNWFTSTKAACRSVLLPILQEISADAPPECRGRFDHENSRWIHPNGAFIKLVGCETQQDCETARGPSCIANIGDEVGFMVHLEYALDSVFGPMMRRVRRHEHPGTFVGMTLLISTTPFTPGHFFCQRADRVSLVGHYRKLTVYDSGWESPEQIEAYIETEAAKRGLTVADFKATSTFRREYLSERVIDEENVVFPEFHREREHIVRASPRPAAYERYVRKRVSVDPGMSDKTGLLFGYQDFERQKAVVCGELLLTKPNTEAIAKACREQEAKHWPGADEHKTSRVVDDTHGRMVLDLWSLQRIRFEQAIKHDRDASIGMVRTLIQRHQLEIDPSCVQLQKQLLECVRDGTKRDFARNADGHFDLCAALMYFVRGLDLRHNPYPPDFDFVSGALRPPLHPLVQRATQMHSQRPVGLVQGLMASRRR